MGWWRELVNKQSLNELALFAGAGGGDFGGTPPWMANSLRRRMGALPSKRIVRQTK